MKTHSTELHPPFENMAMLSVIAKFLWLLDHTLLQYLFSG